MERCFDAGETDKKNRYTAQSCEKLMKEQLGNEMTLTRRQIKKAIGVHTKEGRAPMIDSSSFLIICKKMSFMSIQLS